jgi:hypothetical protein
VIPDRRTFSIAFLALLGTCVPLHAQQWTADVYAGGSRYDALGAQATSANSIVANVRMSTRRFASFISAAAPLDRASPAWTALGGTARLLHAFSPLSLGIELATDGFLFRHSDGSTGGGASLHALPLAAFALGAAQLEVKGGRREYLYRAGAESLQRHVYEVGARAALAAGPATVIGEAKTLTAHGEAWPFAGVQVVGAHDRFTTWAGVGRWFGDDIAETTWQAGASADLGPRGEVWFGAQRIAADPLYASAARSTWNVGYSIPLGRASSAETLPAPALRDGSLIIRLPRTGRAARGTISIAGEFNGWTPVAMQAAGDAWEVAVPAASGVVRFAFVDESGEWFVPEGYPGRMSDDMGGFIAVVVVP